MIDAEMLAQELHEAGREAVEKGATVAAEKFGEQTRRFLNWDEITEPAREGRRIQARYLLRRFKVVPIEALPVEDVPDTEEVRKAKDTLRDCYLLASDSLFESEVTRKALGTFSTAKNGYKVRIEVDDE